MENLPYNILTKILLKLPLLSITNLLFTCHKIKNLCDKDELWILLIERDYPYHLQNPNDCMRRNLGIKYFGYGSHQYYDDLFNKYSELLYDEDNHEEYEIHEYDEKKEYYTFTAPYKELYKFLKLDKIARTCLYKTYISDIIMYRDPYSLNDDSIFYDVPLYNLKLDYDKIIQSLEKYIILYHRILNNCGYYNNGNDEDNINYEKYMEQELRFINKIYPSLISHLDKVPHFYNGLSKKKKLVIMTNLRNKLRLFIHKEIVNLIIGEYPPEPKCGIINFFNHYVKLMKKITFREEEDYDSIIYDCGLHNFYCGKQYSECQCYKIYKKIIKPQHNQQHYQKVCQYHAQENY